MRIFATCRESARFAGAAALMMLFCTCATRQAALSRCETAVVECNGAVDCSYDATLRCTVCICSAAERRHPVSVEIIDGGIVERSPSADGVQP